MATERQTVDIDTFPVNSEEASLPTILQAIAALSEEDYRELKAWLEEYDWDRWDKQIGRDSESGVLDFLADEVRLKSRRRPPCLFRKSACSRRLCLLWL